MVTETVVPHAAPAGWRGLLLGGDAPGVSKRRFGACRRAPHRLFARRGSTLSVSVVIPCYNQGRFLREAIASATAQGELVQEIVVVDDGSTDETHAVATQVGTVRYLRQERSGLSEARNSGWRASSGDYVIFVDADDRLLPGAVEAGLEAFGRWPHVAFVFGHYELIDEHGAVLPTWRERRIGDDRTFTTGDFELVLPDGRRAGNRPSRAG